MSKKPRRTAVPKRVRDRVLKEYSHRCAICGGDRPQLHHIDENPSNHDPFNLLPLCPTCHLTDRHDPTAVMDQDRLKLFRIYRDPAILDERFVPLWKRCQFLLDFETRHLDDLREGSEELIQFVGSLQMGDFYSKQLRDLVGKPPAPRIWSMDMPTHVFKQWDLEDTEDFRRLLRENRDTALTLIVELLRYQDWDLLPKRRK